MSLSKKNMHIHVPVSVSFEALIGNGKIEVIRWIYIRRKIRVRGGPRQDLGDARLKQAWRSQANTGASFEEAMCKDDHTMRTPRCFYVMAYLSCPSLYRFLCVLFRYAFLIYIDLYEHKNY
jgi:hypothetical protein